MDTLNHVKLARKVSNDPKVVLGSILPDVIIGPIGALDRLNGKRINAPEELIFCHRVLHSVWMAILVYKISKPTGVGWFLHIAADYLTHDKPERTPLLFPLER